MDRITVMKSSINGSIAQVEQQPTFDVMELQLPSLSYTSFTQKPNMRNASFSAYLKPNPPAADDCEISIFDAQKYFNETNDQNEGKQRVSGDPVVNHQLDGISEQCDLPRFSSVSDRNYRARSFHATPTASSEASWNSQTGLLSNPPGSIKVSFKNLPTATDCSSKKIGSTLRPSRWFFGKRCPCSGNKSVQVEEKKPPKPPLLIRQNPKSVETTVLAVTPNKTLEWPEKRRVIIPNNNGLSHENNRFPPPERRVSAATAGRSFGDGNGGFSFPILNPSSPPEKLILRTGNNPLSTEDPPRDSLDVFRPPEELTSPAEYQQKDCRSFTFPASPKSRMTNVTDDDVASDASSDLFEIESFSTQSASYPMYHRRDSLEEETSYNARRITATNGGGAALYCRRSLDDPRTPPSIAPTECYEPSEASIDWSVTTAEGFDRTSVTNFSIIASEADEILRHEWETRGGGGGGKKRGNGLLSCRCEKAVNVGPHPVKCVPAEGHRVPVSSTLRHVSSRPPNFSMPSLPRSH